jgi:hypothetical protein
MHLVGIVFHIYPDHQEVMRLEGNLGNNTLLFFRKSLCSLFVFALALTIDSLVILRDPDLGPSNSTVYPDPGSGAFLTPGSGIWDW